MTTIETCDVVPVGFFTNKLTAGQRLALAKSGAIPATLVRERAIETVMVALGTAVVILAPAILVTRNLLG